MSMTNSSYSRSGKDRSDSSDLAKIDQSRIQISAVGQASIFIGPMLKQNVDVAMRGHETVRPEWYAAFVKPVLYLIRRGLEDAGPGNDHLKLAIHSAKSRQYAFSHFADQPYRKTARFTFSRDPMFRKTCWTQFAGQ